MIKKQTIESQLHCVATAELKDSVENDLMKTDGNLKELLDDKSSEDELNNSDRGVNEK
jgi:hypothetical protein